MDRLELVQDLLIAQQQFHYDLQAMSPTEMRSRINKMLDVLRSLVKMTPEEDGDRKNYELALDDLVFTKNTNLVEVEDYHRKKGNQSRFIAAAERLDAKVSIAVLRLRS